MLSATYFSKRSGARVQRMNAIHPPQSCAEQLHALEPHRVHQVEHVRGHVLLVVALGRRLGLAEAAQVGHDHAVAGIGERGDLVAPLVPVLRPAVEDQDRVAVGRAGLDHVHPQAGGVDLAFPDAVDAGSD